MRPNSATVSISRVEISTLGDMFDPKDSATPGEQAVNVPSFPREVVGTGHVPSWARVDKPLYFSL